MRQAHSHSYTKQAPKGNYTPSREERKPVNQVKKAIMGADVSKQRLDAATKTGAYVYLHNSNFAPSVSGRQLLLYEALSY